MKIEDIKPVGHRLLLKTETVVQEKNIGGQKLILMSDKEQKRQEGGNICHEVVAVGPDAFKHESFNGQVWCEVGDIIITSQYPGQKIKFNGFNAWFINDDDVLAKLEKENG